MPDVICVRMIWDRRAIELGSLPGRWHSLHYGPEAEHPFGRRGLAMAEAWSALQMSKQEAGMVLLDGDVAVDPHDVQAMLTAIHFEPAAVHVAPVKIWPKSTTWDAWAWGHYRDRPSQERCVDPRRFGFSFTYLPRCLLAACVRAGLRRWAFPTCDTRVSATAARIGVAVRVVESATPTHMHY